MFRDEECQELDRINYRWNDFRPGDIKSGRREEGGGGTIVEFAQCLSEVEGVLQYLLICSFRRRRRVSF
jgi:hypothetical protein